jgi:hypothetical protein
LQLDSSSLFIIFIISLVVVVVIVAGKGFGKMVKWGLIGGELGKLCCLD